MARELEGLERQIEVAVAAHDRDKRVISEICPEVHGLFFQLGCRDNIVPEKYQSAFMTDRNLMRMLGLVDQQTVTLMSMFTQLNQKLRGSSENVGALEQQMNMNAMQQQRAKTSQLSRKPEPPKMGDFDESGSGEDDMAEVVEESDSSDSSSTSSSDSDDDSLLTTREKRRRAKKKAEKSKRKEGEKKKRLSALSSARSSRLQASASVQKPEPIANLRKKVQRQIESGNHRHQHSSVMRFEPTRKDHFKKRETSVCVGGPGGSSPGGPLSGLGITPEQLAALQGN